MAPRVPTARLISRSGRTAAHAGPETPIEGPARLGKRTKDLVKRLGRGEIAVIDHADLDRVAAEDLVASGVSAVLNNAVSTTGHYPNIGPLLVVRAGIALVDFEAETDLFELLDECETIELRGGTLLRGGEQIATGDRLTEDDALDRLDRLRERID